LRDTFDAAEQARRVRHLHGDWQHDNLLIAEGGTNVTLVDYDGVYVPEFAGRLSPEAGHPNYQHPDRTAENFGPGMDRFSCLVIQAALLSLAIEPGLWARFSMVNRCSSSGLTFCTRRSPACSRHCGSWRSDTKIRHWRTRLPVWKMPAAPSRRAFCHRLSPRPRSSFRSLS
jgi:hypothetical protein